MDSARGQIILCFNLPLTPFPLKLCFYGMDWEYKVGEQCVEYDHILVKKKTKTIHLHTDYLYKHPEKLGRPPLKRT